MKSSDKNKEEWIEKAMNSLEGIQPAEAPAYLYQKILQKLDDKIMSFETGFVSLRLVSIAAVLIILLVSADLLILNGNYKQTGIEKIASYYRLNDNNIIDNL